MSRRRRFGQERLRDLEQPACPSRSGPGRRPGRLRSEQTRAACRRNCGMRASMSYCLDCRSFLRIEPPSRCAPAGVLRAGRPTAVHRSRRVPRGENGPVADGVARFPRNGGICTPTGSKCFQSACEFSSKKVICTPSRPPLHDASRSGTGTVESWRERVDECTARVVSFQTDIRICTPVLGSGPQRRRSEHSEGFHRAPRRRRGGVSVAKRSSGSRQSTTCALDRP